jgi:SAM-dependent methyltransferase
VLTGYQLAAVVTAACRLGLFDALSPTEPRPPAQLASSLEVSAAALAKLLAALEAIGLVTATPAGYLATGFAATELGSGGDLRHVVEKEGFFAGTWLDLAETVRTGRPRLDPWRRRLVTEPDQARDFLVALDVLARRTGPDLARLPALAPGRRVVDVGGGLGTYSRLLAAAGSTVTLVDLPEVIAWAAPRLAGVPVTIVAADVLAHPTCGVPAGSQDAALVSHLVHDLDRETAVGVLSAAASAVRSGGWVVVNDFAGDSGPGAFGPLFDLMMALETGGNAYPRADLVAMMKEAGLTEVTVEGFDPPLTVISGAVP